MTSPEDFLNRPIWYWGMACAWIMHRDPAKSVAAFDAHQPKNLASHYEIGEMSEQLRSEQELIDALTAGDVSAVGNVDGRWRAIDASEWIDSRPFPQDTHHLGMGSRRRSLKEPYWMRTLAGDDIRDVRLNGKTMLRHWPPFGSGRDGSDTTQPRPTGRPPTIINNVIKAIHHLYPDKDRKFPKTDTLVLEINEYLKSRGIKAVSKPTVIRAKRIVERDQN